MPMIRGFLSVGWIFSGFYIDPSLLFSKSVGGGGTWDSLIYWLEKLACLAQG